MRRDDKVRIDTLTIHEDANSLRALCSTYIHLHIQLAYTLAE